MLNRITPYLPSIPVHDYEQEPLCLKLFIYLNDYFLLIHSSEITGDPRGGNFFAHVILIDDFNFSALDAACNITSDHWITHDCYTNDWPHDSLETIPNYIDSKADLFSAVRRFILDSNRTTSADNSVHANRCLRKALTAVEHLLETECLSRIILLGKNIFEIETAIQIIISSLPDQFLKGLTFVNIGNELEFPQVDAPTIIGWLDVDLYTEKREQVQSHLRIPNKAVIRFEAGDNIEYKTQYARHLDFLWRHAGRMEDIEAYMTIIAKFSDPLQTNPFYMEERAAILAGALVGYHDRIECKSSEHHGFYRGTNYELYRECYIALEADRSSSEIVLRHLLLSLLPDFQSTQRIFSHLFKQKNFSNDFFSLLYEIYHGRVAYSWTKRIGSWLKDRVTPRMHKQTVPSSAKQGMNWLEQDENRLGLIKDLERITDFRPIKKHT